MRTKAAVLTFVLAGSAAGVWAGHPEASQMSRVVAVAHDLERAAHHVRDSVDRHHRRAFDDLYKKARHFHREAERYRSDPRHTEDDFDDLVHAYERAARAVHHMDHHLEHDFEAVESHMHALMDAYGVRYARPDSHGRHSR